MLNFARGQERHVEENGRRHTGSATRSFIKRNAVGMLVSAIIVDYWREIRVKSIIPIEVQEEIELTKTIAAI